LRQKGTDVKRVMIPLFLHSEVFTPYSGLLVYPYVSGQRNNKVQRLVVEVLPAKYTGENIFIVEGSDDRANWERVASVNVCGEETLYTVTFESEFSYYRLQTEIKGGDSIPAKVYLVETSFDDCIVYATLEIITASLTKTREDNFFALNAKYSTEFVDAVNNLTYAYDYDSDGFISEGETKRKHKLKIVF